MKLNKAQTIVITFLNIVIVVLAAVLLFVPLGGVASVGGRNETGGDGGNGGGGGADVPHVKLRDANRGAVPQVLRETRLMGNGDETVAAVFFIEGVSYIFGNATVKGLDFDDYGGFLCVVNAAGTILSFTYYDGFIGAASIVEGGFAVGAGESLYFTDFGGDAVKMADTDGPVADILCAGSAKTAVVTQPTPQSLKLTEYNVVGDEWKAGRATRIISGFDLDFFDCYYFKNGQYVISARASSQPRYEALAFFKFDVGGDAVEHYEGGSAESITRPYAVMPYKGGYLAIASKNGIAALVTLDPTLKLYQSKSLDFTFDDARLFMCGGKYYACFYRSDGAFTLEIEENLNHVRKTAFEGVELQYMIAADTPIAAGRISDGAAIIGGQDSKLSLEISGAVIYDGNLSDDGITLVLSSTGGAALSKPTAERDIYVITVDKNAL